MMPVFADTAFYVAFHNRRAALHVRALEFASRLTAPIVTTEFVLLEVANFFRRPGDRGMFAAFDGFLRSDSSTTIVPASSELYAQGRNLFAARSDKEWSLIDCTSFHVMTERGLTDALTADDHFEQAGFRALLKLEAGE
jgi:predicted nucleic acid-binding protein